MLAWGAGVALDIDAAVLAMFEAASGLKVLLAQCRAHEKGGAHFYRE